MIRVNVLYANKPGATFDMEYYLTKHMPMLQERMGAALKAMTVDQGLNGGQLGIEASYRVITALMFDSLDSFERAFTPFAGEIQADIPRFTNVTPTVQISDVRM
jgi:uncharacterized protein (TIGR02118 family)